MPYTTANNVTSDATSTDTNLVKVQDYFDGAQGGSQVRLDAFLRRSERLIRDVAPPPDPNTDEYRQAAADAELMAFEFLWQRPDYVERNSVVDESVTFASADELTKAIARAMGGYTVERLRPGAANTAYIGRW